MKQLKSRFRKAAVWATALVVLLGAGPCWNLASGAAVLQGDWSRAYRGSAGTAPDPASVKEAIVQVYAARAFEWRGAFAVHSWIAVKPTGADSWTTYQVIGWSVRRGGKAVVIRNEPPDRYWFGDAPVLLAERRGDGVDDIIHRIDNAARSYPWNDSYSAWPGPNSNTFTAWIGRKVPELKLELPSTAIGKDWLGDTTLLAAAPSGTGYQFSLYGVFGVLAARKEGLEVNIAGLTLGVDPGGMAIKLPGLGRIGPYSDGNPDNTVLGSGDTNR
jgi:hypothetical protein